MYSPPTTMSRHRIVSVDGHWMPGNSALSSTSTATSATSRRDLSFLPPNGGYTHLNSADGLSSSSTAIRPRRSHRPRGSRGGRKNRKTKSSTNQYETQKLQNSSLLYHDCHNEAYQQYTSSYAGSNTVSSLPSSHTTGGLVAMKGDLSPYQHLKLISHPWNSVYQGVRDSVTSGGTSINLQESLSRQHQMLPPPVPSALFDSHRQNIESMMNSNKQNILGNGLKMLPSFDNDDIDENGDGCDDFYNQYSNDVDGDDDDSTESIEVGMSIPPRTHNLGGFLPRPKSVSVDFDTTSDRNNHTVATDDNTCSFSRSRSSSSSDDSSEWNLLIDNQTLSMHHHVSIMTSVESKAIVPTLHVHITTPQQYKHQQPTAGGEFGSLFVTSPRSFLFGIGSSTFPNDDRNNNNSIVITNTL